MPDSAPKADGKWVGSRPIRPDGVDKVTGRAKFGADLNQPGQLVGKVLRSPHPHAAIRSIDASKALALAGVKAVVTRDDFPEIPPELAIPGEGSPLNFRDMSRNVMAREKALYEGHAVAAVAATSASIAKKALKLIEVDYEVLPHVIDVEAAMAEDAPLLHDHLITQGVNPAPEKPSNVAKRVEFTIGDVEKGFEEADVVIERSFKTAPVHQGYIEPHACLGNVSEDGTAELWCCTQGHFVVRSYCARLLGWEVSKIRVTSSEIGGGFGGKTVVYLEPLSLALSKKAGRPVKMIMSRDEVFKASGPTSGTSLWAKVGVTKDGRITAGDCLLKYQAGAFPGAQVGPGAMCAFAPYDLENARAVGYDVVVNRPKVAAYRAPGAPMAEYAVECVIDELAEAIGMDPLELRLKNAAKEGTRAAYGPKFGPIGYIDTVKAVRDHPNAQAELGPNQGRGYASGFWFNIGGETSASVTLGEDGTISLMLGTPDIGGSRASVAMMVADEMGIDYHKVRPIIGDTSSLGYTFLTGGSRTAFASGITAIKAAQAAIKELCARAAQVWEIPEDAVVWEDGEARPAGENAGKHDPLSLPELADMAGKTGGPIVGYASLNVQGAGPSFGTHMVDVEVDPETGRAWVIRYTVAQDAGKAVHPSYVEGQYHGGAVQGVGWALNEEYIYGEDGKLQNAGFLDYRIPVASDVPMIDTVIVEKANPTHPHGVRGVGETPIIPPMAAIANAIYQATGQRFYELPMSPPKVLKTLGEAKKAAE